MGNGPDSGNGTAATAVISGVDNDFRLISAVVTDFPTVAIPELASCANFLHFGSAENTS